MPQASVSAASSPAARAKTRTVMLLTLGFSMLSFSAGFFADFALALGAAVLAAAFAAGLAAAFAPRRLGHGLGRRFRGCLGAGFFALLLSLPLLSSLCFGCVSRILRRPVVRQGRARAFDQRLDRVGEVHFGDIVVARATRSLCASISTSAWVKPAGGSKR